MARFRQGWQFNTLAENLASTQKRARKNVPPSDEIRQSHPKKEEEGKLMASA